MKVSIITVCYNSEKYIESAIESVLSQDYADIEYIIVDGNSNDKTIEIIKKYQDRIQKFISEPDSGIYDAMNKGLKLATGDVIGLLNSDDLYINNSILTKVANCFKTYQCDILYGDLYYVKPDNPEIISRIWRTKSFRPGSFKKGWHPPHPTFYVKKEIYLKYGYFDNRYKLAADFELMLRLLEKFKVKSYYISEPLVKMRLGGATNKNFKNIFNQNIECYKAFKSNNLDVNIFYPLYRLIPKLSQFFKSRKNKEIKSICI
jgi:glycosyltransferase involved in cell wall biosynthesis